MLVPTTRLLFWFTLIVIPFSVLGVLHPGALIPAIALMACLLVAAGLDAALALNRLDGLEVELPEVIRFSKDRPGRFDVLIRNPSLKARFVRLGVPLPEDFVTEREDQWIALPAQAERSIVPWSCRPCSRGNYPLRQTFLEALSPLKFWSFRRPAPVWAEIRVYPNLFKERRQLAGLFLHRGTQGIHTQRMVGKGREFEKLREYVPGDSFDDIHWKATAKRGHPVTKIFQIERTQEVYVIVDSSRLSNRPVVARALTSPPSKVSESVRAESALERYLTASLILGLAAEQQNDLFGLVTFSDRVDHFLRAKNGQAHYSACRDTLYTLQPRQVTPDFEEVASFIRLRLRRRALLIFLTALDDPVVAESFLRGMNLLSRQHLVLVNMIQPRDAEPLFSHPNVADLNDVYRRLGGHLQWQKLRELEKVLQRRGVRFHLLSHERLSAQVIEQYLDVKRRQLL